jgi:DHA2 family multidrug resistance protein
MSAAAADARPLPQPAPIAAWRPKRNPWLIAITVTLATFMEVLDTSIANVALPHIAGGLGASQDEATWVLTSYLVANAVILPASAYLTTFLGRKRFYMICVVLFGISSALCGLAPSLGLLIFFRFFRVRAEAVWRPASRPSLRTRLSRNNEARHSRCTG